MSEPGNGSRPASSHEANPELLNRVRGVALGKSGMLFQQALDRVDDALFGYSEKSDGSANDYLNAMRELRLKRAQMSQQFLGDMAGAIARFRRRAAPVARTSEPAQELELSLVDDTQLEQNLAIDGMAGKACSHFASALYALNQRLAVLVGADNVADAENPLGPAQICAALKTALSELEASVAVQLVMLKLFERHLVGELGVLYDETNQTLAAAGVLPHIRYTLPARTSEEPQAVQPVQSAVEESTPTTHATVASAAANEILVTLSALLSARRKAERGLALGDTGPRISDDELLAAVALLQSELKRGAEAPAANPLEQIERVKHDLIDQLRRIGVADPDRRVASAHEDAIDLAAMLFQFVVQDRNLPAEIQALLCRMQIPYVRVALKDRHLFAQREHPARELLNAMAVAGVGWSPQGDRDGALLAQMRTIVDRVVREFDDNFALFDDLRRDFEAFLVKQRKRVELTEHRTAENAQGREKLTVARRHALQAVSARIGGRPLPQLVHDTLMSPWINYLVLMDLRHGPDSREWKSAVNFVDALIWSVQPKTDQTQIGRLDALLPQLQAFLRRGLALVGFHGTDVERVAEGIGVLVDATRESARPAPTRVELLHEAESSLRAVVDRTVAESEVERDEDPQPAALPDDECLQRVRALKVGTWIEFVGDDGNRERAKLSWISTISARFLFVNGKGLKVAERSLPVLANELREQRAIVLDVAPICDRALEAIVARLREEHARAGDKPNAVVSKRV